jgi:hypothetical protein
MTAGASTPAESLSLLADFRFERFFRVLAPFARVVKKLERRKNLQLIRRCKLTEGPELGKRVAKRLPRLPRSTDRSGNEFLAPRYAEDLYLTFIDPVPEDKAARTDEMNKAVGQMPVLTQNEARKNYLGLGPVEGGDQLMAPAGMAPVGTSAQPEGEDQTPQLAKTAEGWNTKAIRLRTGGKTAHSGAHAMRRALTEAFAKQLGQKIASEYTSKSVRELTHSEYMEHWKRFADRSERARDELHKLFHGINKKQREEVLKNLPDATGIAKGIGELFDLKEWIRPSVVHNNEPRRRDPDPKRNCERKLRQYRPKSLFLGSVK